MFLLVGAARAYLELGRSYGVLGSLPWMLGERQAVVAAVEPYDVHGTPHVRIALAFADGTFQQAQLGAESVPEGVEQGDPVLVRFAMNVVVAVERASGS